MQSGCQSNRTDRTCDPEKLRKFLLRNDLHVFNILDIVFRGRDSDGEFGHHEIRLQTFQRRNSWLRRVLRRVLPFGYTLRRRTTRSATRWLQIAAQLSQTLLVP